MAHIGKFTVGALHGEETLLLGGAARKEATVRKIIDEWRTGFPNEALVVFDHKGRFYESANGNPLLSDLASEGSLLPDIIEPFVTNENIASRSDDIAYTIRRFIYHEMRTRDANDKFFDDLGKILTDRMIIYMLETMKNVLRNIAAKEREEDVLNVLPSLNLFLIFCRQHGYIETLMTRTITDDASDSLPVKYALDEGLKNGPVTREYALAKYIFEHELRFQKNGSADAPVPFADILATNGENTNTQRCIKMQADASCADFRSLVTLVTRGASVFNELKTLKLDDFISRPNASALFVTSSGSDLADRGFAPLLAAAVGASADKTGKPVTIIIPDLDRWGLMNYLDALRQSWDNVHFIFGYDNFSRLALESRTSDDRVIESLYSASTQRIWHASEEERITRAFSSYVAAPDVIYAPEDLNEDIRAIEKDGDVEYAAMAETPKGEPKRRRVKHKSARGKSKLWISDGAARREKLTLEALLEEGETL